MRQKAKVTGNEVTDQWEAIEVTIKGNNDKFVTIETPSEGESPINEGDVLAMNPKSLAEFMDLPEPERAATSREALGGGRPGASREGGPPGSSGGGRPTGSAGAPNERPADATSKSSGGRPSSASSSNGRPAGAGGGKNRRGGSGGPPPGVQRNTGAGRPRGAGR